MNMFIDYEKKLIFYLLETAGPIYILMSRLCLIEQMFLSYNKQGRLIIERLSCDK